MNGAGSRTQTLAPIRAAQLRSKSWFQMNIIFNDFILSSSHPYASKKEQKTAVPNKRILANTEAYIPSTISKALTPTLMLLHQN